MELRFGLQLQGACCLLEAEQPARLSCNALTVAWDWLFTARVGLYRKGCACSRDAHSEPAAAGRHSQCGLHAPACLQWLLVIMLLSSSLWIPGMSIVYLLSNKRVSSAEFHRVVPGSHKLVSPRWDRKKPVYASGIRLKPSLCWVGFKPYKLQFSIVVMHVETWMPIFPLFNGEVTDCKRKSAAPS